MKKLIYLLVLSGALTACGGGSDDGQASKALFSEWTSTETGIVLDVTNAQFDVAYAVTFVNSPNTGCNCTVRITGGETSGVVAITACSHYGPVNQCLQGANYFDYTNQNATLTLCLNSDCEVYR